MVRKERDGKEGKSCIKKEEGWKEKKIGRPN